MDLHSKLVFCYCGVSASTNESTWCTAGESKLERGCIRAEKELSAGVYGAWHCVRALCVAVLIV